jgi:uroporphyrin-III C-methyltransferase / precorrin-2 dehydrogenase / sirohydrochlorin ferrochelatase
VSELFPLFLRLEGRRALVVGGGPVAAQRVRQLAAAGARVVVVAPEVRAEIAPHAAEVHVRAFEPADLDGAWLAVAAATPEVNRAVSRAAEARHVFVNAVDDVASASAFCGGVVRRGGVLVALSTEGRAPALAGLLREALDALLPVDVERWTAEAERVRRAWKAAGVAMAERRPLLLRALNALYPTPTPSVPSPSPWKGEGRGEGRPTSDPAPLPSPPPACGGRGHDSPNSTASQESS